MWKTIVNQPKNLSYFKFGIVVNLEYVRRDLISKANQSFKISLYRSK